MASPVVAQVVENATSTAGTNHTINHPTVVAGQLWLIVLDKGSTSATVNAHGDWTELLDEALANGLYIAYRWTTGGEGASTTLVTSANTRTASFLYRITGAVNPSTQAPQIGTTSSGTSATPDPPASATPPSSKDYLFITFYGAAGEEADDDTWSDTPPTNYSNKLTKACGVAGTNLGGLIAAAERALTTGVAENPGTFAKDVSAAWRAQTIMIHPAENVTSTPGVASLTTTLFTPTVTVSDNKTVTPGTSSLTTTLFTPSAVLGTVVVPGVVSLTLTAFTPTVTIESPGTTVTPGTASLVLTAQNPSVILGTVVTPGLASIAVTAFVPTITVSNNISVTPGTASLTITAQTPAVIVGTIVVPGVVALVLTAHTPTVTATQNVTVTPGTATLTLTALLPVVAVSANITVIPGTAALSLTAFTPSIILGTVVVPGVGTLTLSTFTPSIAISENVLVTPGTTTLTLTPFAPTVISFTSYGYQMWYNASAWASNIWRLEVVMRSSSGTVYAQLLDVVTGVPIAASLLTSTSPTLERVVSPTFSLVDGTTYTAQFGRPSNAAGAFVGAQLVKQE